jgi:Skp family chaperone for outer membrane proteins
MSVLRKFIFLASKIYVAADFTKIWVCGLVLISFVCRAHALDSKVESRASGIAVVDVQYILENSTAMQAIRKSIESESRKLQLEIKDKESKLKKQEEDLLGRRSNLNEAEFSKLVHEFDRKVSEAQKSVQEKKVKLEEAHAAAVRKVHGVTVQILEEMSSKKSFVLVLPASQALFANEKLDISKEVLTALNAKLKFIKIEY